MVFLQNTPEEMLKFHRFIVDGRDADFEQVGMHTSCVLQAATPEWSRAPPPGRIIKLHSSHPQGLCMLALL